MPEHHTPPPPSGPLLRRVRLQNFKSVRQQDVPLGQLTLLVGENSSGKSSILQALRLLQQAARAASPGDAFPLNGELISVGTIDDVKSVQADTTDTVAIGVEFSSSEFPLLPSLRRKIKGRTARRGDASLTWRVRLADTAPDEPGSARIRELLLSAEDPLDERRLTLCLERSAPQEATSALPSGHTWSDYVDCDLSLQGALHSEDLSGADSEKRVQIVGGALTGALPSALVTEQPADRALATIWTHRFIDYLHNPAVEPSPPGREEVAPNLDEPTEPVDDLDDTAEFAVAAIARLVEDFGDPSTVLNQRTLDDRYFPEPSELFAHEYDVIWPDQDFGPHEDEFDFDWVVSQLINKITERLATGARVPLLAEEREWRGLASFAEHFEGYLNRRIRYLGPLRAAPEIVMPTSASARTGDIGNAGEYTAAVLRSHGAKRVEVPMPDGNRRPVALADAVDAWSTHLGLVDGVTVSDLPGIGLAVTVRPRGLRNDLSLPSVGVGVSQLIPVLVLCLLAEPGNLILLEQPELHLHPGLQQRLADFFVTIAESGRQLIVETHSEYFVSRIRRRIAADPGNGIRSLTKIVFAERDPDTGITEYRDIDLSPYGDIDDWPQGFFDQAAEEEREILRAGLQKRALQETQAPNNSDPSDG